jgi:hypothetical protein
MGFQPQGMIKGSDMAFYALRNSLAKSKDWLRVERLAEVIVPNSLERG